MEHPQYLGEMVLLFVVAVGAVVLLRFLRFPSIIGFLLTGIAIGPYSWGVIPYEHVGQFAEVGLILLLFTVGLELSPGPLMRAGWRLIVAVLLQFVFTMAVAAPFFWLFGWRGLPTMVILGVAVSLSSTAIVLKSLSDRGEANTATGSIATGVLLLQDVTVIVVMLLLPLFGGQEAHGDGGMPVVLQELLKFAALVVIVGVAHFVLPWLLRLVTRQGGRELVTLFAVLMAAGGAWLAALAHWSPALGACIAGLLLARADQRHQLVAEVTPFRDVFNALFFVSLGMLVDLEILLRHLPAILAMVVITLVVKAVLTAAAVRIAGWPWRIALGAGITLCTVSEFAYVLGHEATNLGLLAPETLNVLIVYTVGTMVGGALLLPMAGAFSERLTGGRRPAGEQHAHGERPLHHVVIVGYGVTGENLAKVLLATRIPFKVVEMSPVLTRRAQHDGHEVIVGDATRMSILEHAKLDEARALVVAINDPRAAESIVAQVSERYPDLFILVRVRFVSNLERLYALGAKLVIPEEFETSIEIAAHVLKEFRMPGNVIDAQVTSLRAAGYGVLRGKAADRAMAAELLRIFQETLTETFYIAEDSPACGKDIAGLNLRQQSGSTIVAIVRGGKPLASPPPDFVLKQGDVMVLVGAHIQLDRARTLLQGRDWAAPEG